MPLLKGRKGRPRRNAVPDAEKMFAIGDDFWVETADGERAFCACPVGFRAG